MQNRVPAGELQGRMNRLRSQMDRSDPDWELIAIIGKINQYYFTGTMQDGLLLIPSDEEAVYWVRRSQERAFDESYFPDIRPMGSYRDVAKGIKRVPGTVYLETELVPLGLMERLKKYLPFERARAVDLQVSKIRAVKSAYELSLMKQAGEIHRRVLEERTPDLLREGMSEVEFAGELNMVLLEEGHHGVVRFGMFDTEIVTGQIGFGERMRLSYAGTVSENVVFFRDSKENRRNIKSADDLIMGLGKGEKFSDMKKYYIWKDIPADNIISFMDSVKTHPHSYKVNSSFISKYIKKAVSKGELNSWAVVLMNSGFGDSINIGDFNVKSVIRSRLNTDDMSSDKYTIRRLMSTNDEWLDMDESIRKQIMVETIEDWKNGKIKSKEKPESPSGRIIRKKREKSKGLLLIYPVDLRQDDKKIIETVGFAISFPYSDTAQSIVYMVNKVYWDNEVSDGGY